jgi:hypothetical protein
MTDPDAVRSVPAARSHPAPPAPPTRRSRPYRPDHTNGSLGPGAILQSCGSAGTTTLQDSAWAASTGVMTQTVQVYRGARGYAGAHGAAGWVALAAAGWVARVGVGR